MKKIIETLKKFEKYIQIGVSAFSLIALFLFEFVNCNYGYGVEGTFTGFTMAMNTYIGYLLILLPVVLILSHFVPKYAAKKPLLSVATPALCIVSWLLTVIFAKTFNSQLSDSTLASGAYITLICYIVLGVYGVLIYKDVLLELFTGNSKKQQ